MEIILGIDFGLKRIGVARSDLNGITPRPLFSTDILNLGGKIDEIEREGWKIKLFIVGYPLNADGTQSEISNHVEKFVKEELLKYSKPIYGIDERYSSIEAEEFLRENPKMSKKYDDNSIAAVIIIKRFLKYGNEYVVKIWNEK